MKFEKYDPEHVTGQACLEWIDKAIGFGNKLRHVYESVSAYWQGSVYGEGNPYCPYVHRDAPASAHANSLIAMWVNNTQLFYFPHDITKRIVGYVTHRADDGGMRVVVLGNEDFNYHGNNYKYYLQELRCCLNVEYDQGTISSEWEQVGNMQLYPLLYDGEPFSISYGEPNTSVYNMSYMSQGGEYKATFDASLDWNTSYSNQTDTIPDCDMFNNQDGVKHITNNKNTTLVYGDLYTLPHGAVIDSDFIGDPLRMIGGNMYNIACERINKLYSLCPASFENSTTFTNFGIETGTNVIETTNCMSYIYNMVLTEDYNQALNYLNTGTLPSDAFLFPLDWNNFPTYEDDDDEPDDVPNNNDPGDNSRDITPNLPVVPSFTPAMMSNYNWYWLNFSEYADFIRWFWNDIGDFNDFDDLINKVKGLYNDVASAVLMCRFFPVQLDWISRYSEANAPTDAIKVGMIQKATGTVKIIDQTQAPAVRDIGHIHIDTRYKSFLDVAPYTQLSIYLPFHGFVDLDIDLFMGHDIYIKCVYDYLTGTIQYFIYYDNQFLVNSFVAKIAVDIPITLQTKNDRDSAVFQNVASTVGGLIGAGAGLMSGNPIGMALGVTQGVQSINGANASAPLNVKGTVGETGALYAPPQCAIILRRPTVQASDKGNKLDTWKHNIGQLCGYGYKLSGLSGKGFTVVHSPRINFTKTTPLQSEVDEIYSYLEKGVIL